MHRRNVLIGLAAGIPLLTGCNTLIDNSSGEDQTPRSTNDAGTPTTSVGSETPTAVATAITDTAQQTSTQTATTVPTSTATAITQPTSTSTVGKGPDTTAVSRDIGLSNLTTYTNNTYSYSIKRPAQWTADTSDPTSISFMYSGITMMVAIEKDLPSTLDQVPQYVLHKTQQSVAQSGGSATLLNQRRVSLSNGTPAILIEIGGTLPDISLRQKILVALANGMAYVTMIIVPKSIYTPKAEKRMDAILTSLTIE
jgi:hypothetical protein